LKDVTTLPLSKAGVGGKKDSKEKKLFKAR
jgi:hypothetical protein